MTRHDPNTDPKFVRESLTFRRMKPWQIGALIAVAALAVIIGLTWL